MESSGYRPARVSAQVPKPGQTRTAGGAGMGHGEAPAQHPEAATTSSTSAAKARILFQSRWEPVGVFEVDTIWRVT